MKFMLIDPLKELIVDKVLSIIGLKEIIPIVVILI
jgi:hypothetical protein